MNNFEILKKYIHDEGRIASDNALNYIFKVNKDVVFIEDYEYDEMYKYTTHWDDFIRVEYIELFTVEQIEYICLFLKELGIDYRKVGEL